MLTSGMSLLRTFVARRVSREPDDVRHRRGMRLRYTSHLTLLADEVVKLFYNYTEAVYDVVHDSVPQSEWDRYVETTLKEAREKDV